MAGKLMKEEWISLGYARTPSQIIIVNLSTALSCDCADDFRGRFIKERWKSNLG
jgi:hypothetical protein